MTNQDKAEFVAYLKGCTDRQVQGVYDKETAANRRDYAQLAKNEMQNRKANK